MATSQQPYPFDDAWKASVDRSGFEWMAYCESANLVKRYIRTRLQEGKDAAVEEFEATCDLYSKQALGAARVARIREQFQLIWTYERESLKARVLEEDALPKAA